MRYALPVLLLALPGLAAAGDALDAYLRLATGSFDSSAQAARDQRYETAVWHIVEIPGKRTATAAWLYAENWIDGSAQPYRQRVIRVRANDDGTLSALGYRIPDAARFVGAWRTPSKLAALPLDSLESTAGCEMIIARSGPAAFEGSTLGHDCRNDYKGAAYVLSRSLIDEARMLNWDRGFTAEGVRVWGPADGGYEFRRRAADH